MKNKKSSGRTVLAHVVLIILAFLCLFFFYILIVNATRSHAQLQLGFSALPGSSLITNFKSVINDPAIPILKGIQNSLIVSGCCAAIVTYFSALTAYGIYAYDFKLKRAAFTFIMAILVMPTQVTTIVQMHNELRDTPKTGDDFNPALWVSLAAAFTIGAGVLGFLGIKGKKKKED